MAKGQRLTDWLLAWAVCRFLPSNVLWGRELQGTFRPVETCSACSNPIPAPSLEAAQWSNRAAIAQAVSKGFGKGLLIPENQGILPALWRMQPLYAALSSAHTGPVRPAVSGSACHSWTAPLPKPARDSQIQQRSQHSQTPQHRRSKAEVDHSSGTCIFNIHGFNSQYLAHG